MLMFFGDIYFVLEALQKVRALIPADVGSHVIRCACHFKVLRLVCDYDRIKSNFHIDSIKVFRQSKVFMLEWYFNTF